MNRVLLLSIGVAFIGIVAFAGFMMTGGGRQAQAPIVSVGATRAPTTSTPAPPDKPAPEPLQSGAEAGSDPGAPSQQVTESAEARAVFTQWARRLEPLGLSLTAGAVGREGEALAVSKLDMSSSGPGFNWHWVASSARIQAPEAAGSVLSASGEQAFSITHGGTVSRWSGAIEQLNIKMQEGANGPFRTVMATAEGLALSAENGTAPISLGSGEIEINLGAGTLPPSSVSLIDFALPAWAESPFGSAIDRLEAELGGKAASSGALTIGAIDLQWGALAFSGHGSVGLDEDFRPTGELDVEIADVLAALDTLVAAQRLDSTTIPETYASLLQEMTTKDRLPFLIPINQGIATLVGAPYEIADIPLFTVSPLAGTARNR